ncbi:galanin receptor 2a-like isoform X2 [Paramacrobiotus metropolitanus]|uniref:galanin receptor 2a-like isoform X2 n=1 Tax=Paramacrobiotus metropolitanus TaxID=2943436 RepID=UPI002446460A|nr:galanin receptor 2a-like isoform X2 [Paramacrobiotus metropolitanus]
MDYTGSTVVYDEYGKVFPHDVIPYDDPEVMKKPWIFDAHFVPIIFVYSMCFILGSIGNLLVIWAMQRNRGSRTVTAMFLVSLAVADILLLLSAPVDVASYFVRTVEGGNLSCKLVAFCRLLIAFSTVLNLMAITMERYLVIVYPMKSRQLSTVKSCKRTLFAVWVLSIFLASPSLYTWEVEPFYYGKFTNDSRLLAETVVIHQLCEEVHFEDIMSLYRLLLLFILPLAMHCFCYGRMIRVLWSSTANSSLVSHTGHRTGNGSPPKDRNVDNDTLLDVPATNRHMIRYQSLTGDTANESFPVGKNRRSRTDSLAYTEIPKHSNGKRSGKVIRLVTNWKQQDSRTQLQRHSETNVSAPTSYNAQKHPNSSTDLKAGRRQVIKMLLVVNFAFLIGYGPAVIFDVLRMYGLIPIGDMAYVTKYVVKLLPYAHCCFNPVIYGFMSKNFRRSLRKACTGTCLCCAETKTTDNIHMMTPEYSVIAAGKTNRLNSIAQLI